MLAQKANPMAVRSSGGSRLVPVTRYGVDGPSTRAYGEWITRVRAMEQAREAWAMDHGVVVHRVEVVPVRPQGLRLTREGLALDPSRARASGEVREASRLRRGRGWSEAMGVPVTLGRSRVNARVSDRGTVDRLQGKWSLGVASGYEPKASRGWKELGRSHPRTSSGLVEAAWLATGHPRAEGVAKRFARYLEGAPTQGLGFEQRVKRVNLVGLGSSGLQGLRMQRKGVIDGSRRSRVRSHSLGTGSLTRLDLPISHAKVQVKTAKGTRGLGLTYFFARNPVRR